MTFTIPDHFHLAGQRIVVVKDPTLAKREQKAGQAIYVRQKIVLDVGCQSKQAQEQSYLHELTHFVLHTMNEHEINDNEKFVDLFSRFLHQALTGGKTCRCQEKVTTVADPEVAAETIRKGEAAKQMEKTYVRFDPWQDVPKEIFEAALAVEQHFKRQGIKGWKLAGCADRSMVE